MPEPSAVEEARAKVGISNVELNEQNFTVRFARPGVMLDLGAIGKGYALEEVTEILREGGIENALLHGGTSTIQALGHPPDGDCWKVAVEYPRAAGTDEPRKILATVELRDEALSVSAVWGRSFEAKGKTFGHVLDPRSGQPVAGAMLAAVSLPSATETDALSTALLVLAEAGHDQIANLRHGMRTLVVTADTRSADGFRIISRGIPKAH